MLPLSDGMGKCETSRRDWARARQHAIARQAWRASRDGTSEAREMTEQRPHAARKRRRWRQTQREASTILLQVMFGGG